ncbi:MAG: hypothetical protein U9P38_03195 [Campylobacterota bacterium]|nr:hypothetical protein [Campylobacterota bacterium]
MIIFGHRFIESDVFYHVLDVDSIRCTPPSSTLYIDFDENDLEIINHANLNKVSMAITISTITELIYAASLGAKYIVVPKNRADIMQKIAENYLFDAKILVLIEHEKEIEEFAIMGVDGVLFSTAIIRTNS